MLKQTNVYEEARKRLHDLEIVRRQKGKALQSAPAGKIHVLNSGGRVQFYLRSSPAEVGGRYLSLRKEKAVIQLYLQKQYDEKVLKQINLEIRKLEAFLTAEEAASRIPQLYSDNPIQIKQFLKPVDCSFEDYAANWLSIPYTGKIIQDTENAQHTNKGEWVRSKSELNIANALFRWGIPYKYECPLVLNNGFTIYPDFTVLHPISREEIYWEHRGMMDDREYVKHAIPRIRQYEEMGIFLGKNLIITEETSTRQLVSDEIEKTIECYFT